MANSREILLKLVRLAMGWESDYTLPEDINWDEVIDMSSEQGITAIILDGYENLTRNNPDAIGWLNSKNNKTLLLQAIGQVQIIESTYYQHVEALKELGKVLGKWKIPFTLMKGFSCGQYYPIPKHRSCGDIDIFPGQNFDSSNLALTAEGIKVEPDYYRHTVSYVKGVMVENHCVLCDLRGPISQTKALEEQLEEEGNKSIMGSRDVNIDGVPIVGAKYPTANFHALFLPWHVSAHFMFERFTIRQLLDWALFIKNEGKSIDYVWFKEAKKKYTYGYSKFADLLTALSLKYLNLPTDDIPLTIISDAQHIDEKLVDRVFNYIFEGQPKEKHENIWKKRISNVKRIWKERWKYRACYDMSIFRFLFYKGVGAIFNIGNK